MSRFCPPAIRGSSRVAFWKATLAICVIAGVALSWAQSGNTRNDLRRLLDGQTSVNATLVQRRFLPEVDESFVVKVDTGKVQGMRVSILSPLSNQGITSIDDMKELRTYYPDRKTIVVQTSPNIFRPSLDARMRLIDRNYTVSSGGTSTILGRRTSIIVVTPKNEDMYVRRMWVDQKVPLLLRYEMNEKGEKPFTLVETLSIDLDTHPANSKFKFDTTRDVRIQRAWGPETIKDMKFAAAAVGFQPRIPSTVPYGFSIISKQLVGSEANPIVGLRLTDGMAQVTLYQWLASKHTQAPMESKPQAKNREGVQFLAAGDAPAEVLRELAAHFARQP